MSPQRQLFWLLVFLCFALMAFNTVAKYVHITIEFGVQPIRIQTSDVIDANELLRALPAPSRPDARPQKLFTPAGGQVTASRDNAPRTKPGVNHFPDRFRFVCGRVPVSGAQSDAGLMIAQSCRPGFSLLEI